MIDYRNDRRFLVVVGIGLILLLSGCLTITTEATVKSDGGLNEYYVELDMKDEVYNLFLQDSQEEGYDDVEAWARAQVTDGSVNVDNATIDSGHTEREDGSHRVWVSISNVSPEVIGEQVEATQETVTYRHEDPFDLEDQETNNSETEFSEYKSQVELNYIVNMPGEIIESNADTISNDGTTAEWSYLLSSDPEDIYVQSERPTGVLSDVTPLTPIPAVAAIILFTIAIARR